MGTVPVGGGGGGGGHIMTSSSNFLLDLKAHCWPSVSYNKGHKNNFWPLNSGCPFVSLDFTDDKSTLVQVMACCHQATSHYLNQCWPISMMPYPITGHQWAMHCSAINRPTLDNNVLWTCYEISSYAWYMCPHNATPASGNQLTRIDQYIMYCTSTIGYKTI